MHSLMHSMHTAVSASYSERSLSFSNLIDEPNNNFQGEKNAKTDTFDVNWTLLNIKQAKVIYCQQHWTAY